MSVVLFQLPEATPVLALGGEVPRPLNHEAADPTLQHPKVPVYEDPVEQQRREQVLKAAAEKARHEWRQTAAQKAWNTIKAGLDVYRHAGEVLTEDPRRQPKYVQQVLKGLRLDPVGEEYNHLTAGDLAALKEMIERKAAAFWVPGTPRTTVKFFQHDTIPTGPPCRLPPHNLKGEQAQWTDERLSLIHI